VLTRGVILVAVRFRFLVALLLLASSTRADGKLFAPAIPVVETPDQQAILVYRNGRERLVIDTSYDARAERLAWVVPLPSAPEVTTAPPDLFRTLQVLVAPRVEHPDWEPVVLAAYALAVVALLGFFATGPRRLPFWLTLVLVVAGMAGMGFMFPPTLGARTVTVLSHHEVGAYDVTTVTAADAAELLPWLRDHGFQVADEAARTLDDYLRDGWVFALAQVRAEGGPPEARPGPLRFDFPSPEAVYPLRLTGAASTRDLRLDLYVFADQRARCDALPAVCCVELGPPLGPPDEDPWYREWPPNGATWVELVHPGLRDLAGGTHVLTKLSGVLHPTDMRRDLVLDWEPFTPLTKPVHTTASAASSALAAGAWTTLALLLPVALLVLLIAGRSAYVPRRTLRAELLRLLFSTERRLGRRGLRRVWATALGVGIAVTMVLFLTKDRVAAFPLEGAAMHRHLHRELADQIGREAPTDLDLARQVARRFWQPRKNPYTAAPVDESASPGNYTLSLEGGKVLYAYFDAQGAEFHGGRSR